MDRQVKIIIAEEESTSYPITNYNELNRTMNRITKILSNIHERQINITASIEEDNYPITNYSEFNYMMNRITKILSNHKMIEVNY